VPYLMGPRGHDVAVLFSRASRDAYAASAVALGQTYTFESAWDVERTWVKGEYAYLAPSAASLLLARCNLKHDVVDESEMDEAALAGYRALIIPNAAHLAPQTIARIEAWIAGSGRRLLVSGKTNLPPALLGLTHCTPQAVEGFTGWRWLPGSPFSGPAWEPVYPTGYEGHLACSVGAAAASRVLADLVEFSGDLTSAATATATTLGPAIVVTDRTAYIANQVFEMIGGMMQAHLNVEPIRHWANPTHWGDTLLFFLRRLMRDLGLEPLWETRLRSFGTHQGVLSFRHDVHGMTEFSFLDYQIQNLIPASYDIEDPTFSTNITPPMAQAWLDRTSRNNFIEQALHNDSSIGDPPAAVFGKGFFKHVDEARRNLGIRICTCGRHAGGHMHPETIDAMDYLYANQPDLIGACTFSYYHMIEYGVRRPDVMVGGAIGGKPLTYVTDVRRTIATQGIWFPFHPVVTTTEEWKPLRGWDRTHEFDAAYELVETIYDGHGARVAGVDDQLENGVYSFQYHPELGRDPSTNDGKGTLDFVRYAINLAERKNFWIPNQRELYQRMADYEELIFRKEDGGRRLTVVNPGDRTIEALMIEQRLPFEAVWDGDDEIVHVVDDAFVTVPRLGPGESVSLRFAAEISDAPILRKPSNKGLVVLDARHDHRAAQTNLLLRVCRAQPLAVEGIDPAGIYRIQVDDEPPFPVMPRTARTIAALLSKQAATAASTARRARVPGVTRFLDLMIHGGEDDFVERRVRIRELTGADERAARAALLASIPARTGRVL
jgi:hypothetical protein